MTIQSERLRKLLGRPDPEPELPEPKIRKRIGRPKLDVDPKRRKYLDSQNEKTMSRYRRLKAEGMCVYCGQRPADGETVFCPYCREANRRRKAEYNKKHKYD